MKEHHVDPAIPPTERSTENMEARIAEPWLWVLDYLARTAQAIRHGDWSEVDDSAQDIARKAHELAEAARDAATEQRPQADAVMQMIDRRPTEAALFRHAAGLPAVPFHPAIVTNPDGSATLTATGERVDRPQPGPAEQDALVRLRDVMPKFSKP
jgi:hypothetical protein